MKKIVLKGTSEEVHQGDKLRLNTVILRKGTHGKNGAVVSSKEIEAELDKDLISELIAAGVLELKEIPNSEKQATEAPAMSYYVKSLARRNHCSVASMDAFIGTLIEIYPAAALALLLKEIAIDLDDAHEGHIKNSPHIFSVNTIDGNVYELDKKYVKNYQNFAAFRTREDAMLARAICHDLIESMYRSDN